MMISLSLKTLRAISDAIFILIALYLLVFSVTNVLSPFTSLVLLPLALISCVALGYYIHQVLSRIAQEVSAYQLRFIQVQNPSIRKQPLAQ